MPESPKQASPKHFIVLVSCVIIVLLASAVIVAVLLLGGRTQAPASQIQTTLTGESVCLPHKDTSGPQTLECAFGLRTDDNRYYALEFPNNVMNVEFGKRIEVTGTLTTGGDSIYDIVGSIKVESYR